MSLCVGFVTTHTGSIKAAAILSYKAHLCRVRAVKPVFKKIKEKVLVYFHIKKRPTRINLTGTTPGRNIYILQEKISLLEKMNLYQNAYFGGVYSASDEQWFDSHCPWRPQAPTPHCSSAIGRTSTQNTGDPTGAPPSNNSGLNGSQVSLYLVLFLYPSKEIT